MTIKEYYASLEFFHITWEEWAEKRYYWDACVAWGESSVIVEVAKDPNVVRINERRAIVVNYDGPELVVTETEGEWAKATKLDYLYSLGKR